MFCVLCSVCCVCSVQGGKKKHLCVGGVFWTCPSPYVNLRCKIQELPAMATASTSTISKKHPKGVTLGYEEDDDDDDVIAKLRRLPPDMRCGGCGSKVRFFLSGFVW